MVACTSGTEQDAFFGVSDGLHCSACGQQVQSQTAAAALSVYPYHPGGSQQLSLIVKLCTQD